MISWKSGFVRTRTGEFDVSWFLHGTLCFQSSNCNSVTSEHPSQITPRILSDPSQIPPRSLPDRSQIPPRSLSDRSQIALRPEQPQCSLSGRSALSAAEVLSQRPKCSPSSRSALSAAAVLSQQPKCSLSDRSALPAAAVLSQQPKCSLSGRSALSAAEVLSQQPNSGHALQSLEDVPGYRTTERNFLGFLRSLLVHLTFRPDNMIPKINLAGEFTCVM